MSPLRRRSARLRGGNATPRQQKIRSSYQLDSVVEDDKTTNSRAQLNLDAMLASPHTPSAAEGIKPPHHEMHPSHAHPSTAKKPNSALRLGFSDINEMLPPGLRTPSKVAAVSPTFDFRFARPGPQLGPEAQRMMDELREEALRIKAKLVAEREEERRNAVAENTNEISTRRIAQPKGKVGRFSDIHMAEFKKMDSIAGHASAFRGQSGITTHVATSLKRSQSKVTLGEGDSVLLSGGAKTGLSTRSQSNMKLDALTDRWQSNVGEPVPQSTKLESESSPKRARQNKDSDVSSARPISRDVRGAKPTLQRSRSIIESISTPTQASLARAANLQRPASQIPSLKRSPPKSSFTPNLPKSATTNNLADLTRSEPSHKLFSAGKFDRMKSILRRPIANPEKSSLVSPPTISPAKKKAVTLNLDKDLPSLPKTSGYIKIAKNINFALDGSRDGVPSKSTSPIRSGIPRSKSSLKLDPVVGYPALSRSTTQEASDVQYPSLSATLMLSQRPQETRNPPPAPPSVPGTFTFRSDKTINFGNPPHGFGSSPGQSSVRQVRQSVLTAMPGSFPGLIQEKKEMLPPAISQSSSTKKRRRASFDEENLEDGERAAKKHKSSEDGLMTSKLLAGNSTPKTKTRSPAKKGVLSLSRLNILARPKMRR